MQVLIEMCPSLESGELGGVVGIAVFEHGDEMPYPLTSDQWLQVRVQRQSAGRPLHWWEVPTHV